MALAGEKPEHSTARWPSRLHPGVVVAILAVYLTLLCAELSLRLFDSLPEFTRTNRETLGYVYDRTLGYFPAANSRRIVQLGARKISVCYNSMGLRDAEPQAGQRPGLLFLGDSFVWGYNIEADERFTDKLRARHPEWQVYNCGVVGYATDQEFLLLQRYLKRFRPKVVFLIFCTENDIIDNCNNGGGVWAYKPYYTLDRGGLKLRGVPVPECDWVFCLRHPLISKLHLARWSMRAWGKYRSPPPPGLNFEVTRELLKATRTFVTQQGAAFCVGLTDANAQVEQALKAERIPYLDLSTPLRLEGDYHWSPEGNTFVMQKIESFLLSQNLP